VNHGTLSKLIVLAACTAALSGCASAPALDGEADEVMQPGIALASFDSLWNVVTDTYVDTTFVATTWREVRDSLRPQAERVTTRKELDALFARTLARIPDSHFYMIPASIAPNDSVSKTDGRGSTGLVVRAVGNRAVVWRVSPGSAADRAGLRPGQIVERVGDRDAAESLRRISMLPEKGRPRALAELLQRLNGALAPAVGQQVIVKVKAGGRSVERRLVAGQAEGRVSQYASLPPIAGLVRWARVPIEGNRCVGTVAFNVWLPALVPDLAHAVDSVRSCAGVVVDLRGNPGGVGAMVMGFGGYFVDSVKSLGTMRTRQVSLNFVINPQRSRDDGSQMSPFNGPVAILTDALSASTSEIFASGMQRIGRARVFGERSAGAALPALMKRLPSGDVFVHAVADFTDPNGERIEGAGTVPDVEVPLSIEVLEQGRDGPLEAAVEWIVYTSNR
jgi:carboxyl-terminal processing protease